MEGALKGLKVLDLTRVLSGPYATMMLADMGADIIKIEQPGKGDDSRQYGPFLHGESGYFMSINRNKKSMTLNLKSAAGKQILLELAKKVDVVVENFRPGTMEKLGLGYDVMKEENRRIIYAAISGFGRTGPYSRRAAYDGVVQAMGGIMSITGEKGGRPLRVGPSIGDIAAGMFCACGILAAIIHRDKTGEGQLVDVAMLDCQVAILENAISRYVATGHVPGPNGNAHASIFPFETFPARNGEIMIAAGNDLLWRKLCEAIGREDLRDDPLLATNPLRGQNYDRMKTELDRTMAEKDLEDWVEILDAASVPCSPVNGMDRVTTHPQVNARDMMIEMQHPVAGTVRAAGNPVKMSRTPGGGFESAPVLGANTDEILKAVLGRTEAEIEILRQEGII